MRYAGITIAISWRSTSVGIWLKGTAIMPLINCPACNSAVSDQAPACPKCGHTFLAAAPRRNFLVGMLVFRMAAGVLGACLFFWLALQCYQNAGVMGMFPFGVMALLVLVAVLFLAGSAIVILQ